LADGFLDYLLHVITRLSCFLHFHEIGASPRNIHQPVVDFLVAGQSTQLASLYAWSWSEEPTWKNKPR